MRYTFSPNLSQMDTKKTIKPPLKSHLSLQLQVSITNKNVLSVTVKTLSNTAKHNKLFTISKPMNNSLCQLLSSFKKLSKKKYYFN